MYMDKNTILAHVGLGLVTYIPLLIAFVFTLVTPSAQAVRGFLPALLGFLTLAMTTFGWVFLPPSLIIAVNGLMTQDRIVINTLTLLCSAFWIVANFVIANFA